MFFPAAVSETLIVKNNIALLSEDKLASHYCVKYLAGVPVLTAEIFLPSDTLLKLKMLSQTICVI